MPRFLPCGQLLQGHLHSLTFPPNWSMQTFLMKGKIIHDQLLAMDVALASPQLSTLILTRASSQWWHGDQSPALRHISKEKLEFFIWAHFSQGGDSSYFLKVSWRTYWSNRVTRQMWLPTQRRKGILAALLGARKIIFPRIVLRWRTMPMPYTKLKTKDSEDESHN